MLTSAADLVAAELQQAIQAHREAVDGPDARVEADARDRVERAADAAAALLSLADRAPNDRHSANLIAGQQVIWLNPTDDGTVTILRATIVTEVTSSAAARIGNHRHYEIVTREWERATHHVAPTSHLIPVPSHPHAEVRRAG
ncbi:hypothetical protein IU444_28955 [Nocardia farcinica]|uniref:hypothetical protein n=1 Tax=Nocardia farcinica TaxID=37329 RepID=UPI001894D262|nr:hypothetical protein [Nocardia farcinica]MBF6388161.1 hypothetical protein [Nocardia farcinica]